MGIDILAIAAHPDDVELACCGTLLKHAAQGKKIGILDLTRGELGSRGTAELRDAEAKKSTEILQLDYRCNLGLADGFFENNQASLLKIIVEIRRTRPQIVLANALTDRHPDHARAAKLAADACFYAGLTKIITHDENNQIQAAHRPAALYHYIQDMHLKPDFVVDVTPHFDVKIQAIKAFSSQFYDEKNPDAGLVNTPISSMNFWDFVTARARDLGRPIDATYAEGFNFSRVVGVRNLFDLS